MSAIRDCYPGLDDIEIIKYMKGVEGVFRTVGKLAYYFLHLDDGYYINKYTKENPDMGYDQLLKLFLHNEALAILGAPEDEGFEYPGTLKPVFQDRCTDAHVSTLFDLHAPPETGMGYFLAPENADAYMDMLRTVMPRVLARAMADGVGTTY
jgi:hypothetical protein